MHGTSTSAVKAIHNTTKSHKNGTLINVYNSVPSSLIPRPNHLRKKGPVSTVCTCAQFPRNLRKIVDYHACYSYIGATMTSKSGLSFIDLHNFP